MRKRAGVFLAAALTAAAANAALPLMKSPGESKWIVTREGKDVATVTLLANGMSGSRAEWKSRVGGPATVFLGGNGTVWIRGAGGDVDLSSYSSNGVEKLVVPALLLPFTTTATDTVETPAGRPWSYSYRGVHAHYQHDSRGVSRIELTAGDSSYLVTRQTATDKSMEASLFAVRPKKAAASRLARLSGDLLGPSDKSVSATAGGRGVGGSGLKFADGGDYTALEKLEARDGGWKEKLPASLEEFQKDGKVGKERPQ